MTAVILTAHVLIVLTLIGVVLLQRSEGGALGIGGGGFMTGRGAANALTRTTSILAALFFSTSLALAVFGDRGESEESVLQELTGAPANSAVNSGAPATADDLLRTLGTGVEDAPSGVDALKEAVGEEPAEAPAPEERRESVAPASDIDEVVPPGETVDGAPPEDSTPSPE